MTGFWAGLGTKLAEKGILLILTPAFAFWGGGVAAWAWDRGWHDGWEHLGDRITALSGAEQFALSVGAIVLVTVSGVTVERATLPLLRLFEGYWPACLDSTRARIVSWRSRRIARLQQDRDALAAKIAERKATADEQRRHLVLDRRLRRIPTESRDDVLIRRMPTAVGNILRAAESWPADKYGLDAVKCWPRLWLALPESARGELTSARAALDASATVVVWSLLFVVWSVWAWWAAPAGLVVAVAAYRILLTSAAVYGDLLEATFDVHRRLLYEAAGWPLPRSPAEERALGEALTEYLWRGSDASAPIFRSPNREQ